MFHAKGDRDLMEHWNGSGYLGKSNQLICIRYRPRNPKTYDRKPDVHDGSTGISMPLLSRAGEISYNIRMEATTMKTELSARWRPGKMLSRKSEMHGLCGEMTLTVVRIQTGR